MSIINRVDKRVVPINSKMARLIKDFPVKCISRLHNYIVRCVPTLAVKNPIIEWYSNSLIFTDTSKTGLNCTTADLTAIVNEWIECDYLNDSHKQGCDIVMILYGRLSSAYRARYSCGFSDWYMLLDILSNVLDILEDDLEAELSAEFDNKSTIPYKFLTQFDRLDLWYAFKWICKISQVNNDINR